MESVFKDKRTSFFDGDGCIICFHFASSHFWWNLPQVEKAERPHRRSTSRLDPATCPTLGLRVLELSFSSTWCIGASDRFDWSFSFFGCQSRYENSLLPTTRWCWAAACRCSKEPQRSPGFNVIIFWSFANSFLVFRFLIKHKTNNSSEKKSGGLPMNDQLQLSWKVIFFPLSPRTQIDR